MDQRELTCTYPKGVVRQVGHCELEHSTEELQGTVSNVLRVSVPISLGHTTHQHVGVSYCLHLKHSVNRSQTFLQLQEWQEQMSENAGVTAGVKSFRKKLVIDVSQRRLYRWKMSVGWRVEKIKDRDRSKGCCVMKSFKGIYSESWEQQQEI